MQVNRIRNWALIVVTLTLAATGSAGAATAEADPAQASKGMQCGQQVRLYLAAPASRAGADAVTRCFKAAGKLDSALQVFRGVAEKTGGPVEAWKFVAETADTLGRASEAQDAYSKYVQKRPRDIEARLALARLHTAAKAYDPAMAEVRQVLTYKPDYAPALTAQARVMAAQGSHSEALQVLDRVLRSHPRDLDAATARAFTLLWAGRPEESLADFSRLQSQHPRDGSVAQGLQQAQTAVELKKLAAARQTGNTAQLEAYHRQRLATNPNDLLALNALADLTTAQEKCAERIGYRRRAVELSRTDPALELELARALSDCEQLDEAMTRFKRLAELQPRNDSVHTGLGWAQRRAGRLSDAAASFNTALSINPRNNDARLGLAQVLALGGNYRDALTRYDEVLASSPSNYEALQGKAFALFWTSQFVQARQVFQQLQGQRPADTQNAEALKQIVAAEEEARWAAIRPRADAPQSEWLTFYQKRLEAYPNDLSAMKGIAYARSQMKQTGEAIKAYQKVLAAYPDDRAAKAELARLLSWDGQLDAAIRLYQEIVKESPDDTDSIEGLARTYVWASRPDEALQVYRTLLAKNPSNSEYQLEMARLQLRLKDTPAAREFLTAILSADPKNREAMLLLGQMNLNQGQLDAASKYFDLVLKQNAGDADALYGKARVDYYRGDIDEAYLVAAKLVKQQPKNSDATFLLASLERARQNRAAAMALLDDTLALNPGHTEAATMKQAMLEEGTFSIQTTTSYAREIGRSGSSSSRLLDQDLRALAWGTTLSYRSLPRTTSYLSMTFMPVSTPVGALRGAVGPSQFLYRQTTQITPTVALRAGMGLTRFGTGDLVVIPGQTILVPSAKSTPIVLAGITYVPEKRARVDFGFSRSGLGYTPVSTRLGVVESRFGTTGTFLLTPRTELALDYSYGRFTTREYLHGTERRQDVDDMHRGALALTQNVYRSRRFSLDTGYSLLAYGNPGSEVFMGFFNPGLLQQHMFTTRVFGRVAEPFAIEFNSGVGGQHIQGEEWRRALQLNPVFIVNFNRQMGFRVGYIYYNTAQTLGIISGNAVYLTTEWKF